MVDAEADGPAGSEVVEGDAESERELVSDAKTVDAESVGVGMAEVGTVDVGTAEVASLPGALFPLPASTNDAMGGPGKT